MIRKILKKLIHQPSVRADLNTAASALRSALRTIRLEARSDAGELRQLHGIKINVGCGPLIKQGWVNIDAFPSPGAFYVNVVNGFPFADGVAGHIHCEHFLEHLSYLEAEAFLQECHRTLKPGGGLRIVVPDAGKYAMAYARDDREFFRRLEHLGNSQERLDLPMLVMNQTFRMGGDHRHAWDFSTLKASLEQAGFARVEQSRIGDVAEEMRIDGTDDWRSLESLYVNAWKS